MVNMETRHPIQVRFGNEFPSIYNRCGVMADWSRKRLKKNDFWACFGKMTPHRKKNSKLCSESFHRDTDQRAVFKFCEIWPTGNRQSRALFIDKEKNKISPGSPALATVRIAPKIRRGQPSRTYSECSRSRPNRFTFSRVIPERVNTIKTAAVTCFQYSAEA